MAADGEGEGSNARSRAFAEARKQAKTKTIEIDAKKMLTESMANGFDKYMEEVLVARLKTYLSYLIVVLFMLLNLSVIYFLRHGLKPAFQHMVKASGALYDLLKILSNVWRTSH